MTGAWRDVIYKGNDNYYLEGTSDRAGKPDAGGTFAGADADAFGTAALAANKWSYLAVTYDGSTLRLYVNGTQVGSQARTGAITKSTNQLQIGGDSLYGQYFKGLIDEVRVYNIALGAAAIQTDMATPGLGKLDDRYDAAVDAHRVDDERGRPDLADALLESVHRQHRCHRLPHLPQRHPGRHLVDHELRLQQPQLRHHLHARCRRRRCGRERLRHRHPCETDRCLLRHHATLSSRHPDRHRRRKHRDRPFLGSRHRQCRCHRLPDLALPRRRLHQLQPTHPDHRLSDHLQRPQPRPGDHLQLRGPRPRRSRQHRPLHQQHPSDHPHRPPPAMYSVGGDGVGSFGVGCVAGQRRRRSDCRAGTARFSSRRSLRAGRRIPSRSRRLRRARVVLSPTAPGTVGSTDVSSVGVACSAAGPASGSDDFNRADGGLGGAWAAISDGALVDLVERGGRVFGNRRGRAGCGDLRRRSVLVDPADFDAVDGRAVGRAGRASAEQRPRHVSRDLLLEQRQPSASALQAERRQLDAARQLVQLRPVGGRHCAQAGERRLANRVLARRSRTDRCLRRQPQRGAARDHDVRRCERRQLVRRTATHVPPPALYSVGGTVSGSFGRGCVAGQRRRRPHCQRERRVPVRDEACERGGVFRLGQDGSVGRELCCLQRLRALSASTDVSSVGVACSAAGPASGSDDFNRADGGLGGAWAAISDGALCDLVERGGRVFGNRRGRAGCGDLRRRSVLVDPADFDAVDGWAVGRAGRASAEQRPRHVSRDLLLEQRQPSASALQAERAATGLSSAARTAPARWRRARCSSWRASARESRSRRTESNGSLSPTAASARGSPGS